MQLEVIRNLTRKYGNKRLNNEICQKENELLWWIST